MCMAEYDRLGRQIDVQPGETVVGCGHTGREPLSRLVPDLRNGWSWWEVTPPVVIAGPTGNLTSRWIVCCAACRRAAGGDRAEAGDWIFRVEIREHWHMPAGADDVMGQVRALGLDRSAVRAYLEGLSSAELGILATRMGAVIRGPQR